MTFFPNTADCRLIGIDVGGTKVRAIAADAHGSLLVEITEPTETEIIAQLLRMVTEVGGHHVIGVGIGVPGAVHPHSGVVTKVPNVPGLEGVALAAQLREILGVPVVVENDVLTAAMAERRGDDANPLAVIAAGTGIGLGLVYNGEILRGAHGAAGEIADLPVPGGKVLEDHVSISGLMATYRAAGGSTAHTTIELFQEGSAGSDAARQAMNEYVRWLAHGIRTIVATVDPGRIVLTGGLGGNRTVRDQLRQHLDPQVDAILVVSEHGADAPAHGAVHLAQEASQLTPK